ncbi:hypothetical protein ACFSC6_22130 [Rufibacter sediminis]|uniref:YxiG-like domain-containing protein n=1 Tax=Rufibacter sediminis TaxID=2762756 RepID=A0ABR6VUK1_9BACT|nr:hypothetical protein [Rufibacter sediminis]MBC3540839.1 hypothetical protein [Rufibacter sediminis]
MLEQPDLSSITLDDFIDGAILSHGFLPYKRDYFFHIETLWREPLAGQYLLVFRHCYEMNFQIITGGETLLQSWDDCFTNMEEYEKAGEPEGYVWGTNWANAYPGFSVLENSRRAQDWALKLSKPMQEVQLEAEIMKFNFVFFDWTLKKLNNETGLISHVLFPFGD